ncbi:A/G-specific adenine glycosylase [Desulfatirhabdium butyrativorans]|uniref:A/G-specific adenine glycosylase n=1 Tax=Desulfatirhabdium butyrativorans TaxID=340467 RepID=UPI0004190E4C|nr:A/G-specific adenine glycosylase [Desulfatirhabdium butyrativorans]
MSIMPHLAEPKPFQEKLLRWYREIARPLPWRYTKDPYAIWVSEVMLQQTRVDTVLSYFPRFLKAFPDVQRLASASEEQVLKAWEGLGYYGRARNLHKAAKILCDTNDPTVPDSEEALRSLPGIGDYIVAAVLSFAYRKPFAVLDGNVKRVLARLLAIDWAVNNAKAKPFFQQMAQDLLPAVASDLHNQAMMELGALVCTPRHPKCEGCPVSRFCLSRQNGWVDRFPVREKRRLVPIRRIVIAILVQKGGGVLLTRRPSEGLLGGLWEFPNTELDASMSFSEGIQQLCMRFSPVSDSFTRQSIGTVRHAYTHFKVLAQAFRVDIDAAPDAISETETCRWLNPGMLEDYPLSKITHKVLRLMGMKYR